MVHNVKRKKVYSQNIESRGSDEFVVKRDRGGTKLMGIRKNAPAEKPRSIV